MTFYLCTAWPAVESIKLMRLVAIIDVPAPRLAIDILIAISFCLPQLGLAPC